MSTFGGIFNELPIRPFAVASASTLVKGMVVQYNSGTAVVEPWSVGTNIPFGICTGDADLSLLMVDVYVGKGCTVLIKCNTGVIPVPSNSLFFAASGVVGVTGTAGQQCGKAVGTGFNGYVEAILA